MPYRRYYKRRRYPTKTFTFKVKKAMISMATKYKQARELTTTAIAKDAAVASILPTQWLLNDFAQGVAENQRDGDVVFLRNLKMRLEIRSTTTGSEVIRLGLLYYKGDSTPELQQVLDPISSTPDSSWYLAQYRKADHASKDHGYQWIFDKTFSLSTGTTAKLVTELNVNLKGRKTIFNGAGNSDIEKGRLYLFATSDEATAGSPAVVAFTYRITFSDNI